MPPRYQSQRKVPGVVVSHALLLFHQQRGGLSSRYVHNIASVGRSFFRSHLENCCFGLEGRLVSNQIYTFQTTSLHAQSSVSWHFLYLRMSIDCSIYPLARGGSTMTTCPSSWSRSRGGYGDPPFKHSVGGAQCVLASLHRASEVGCLLNNSSYSRVYTRVELNATGGLVRYGDIEKEKRAGLSKHIHHEQPC